MRQSLPWLMLAALVLVGGGALVVWAEGKEERDQEDEQEICGTHPVQWATLIR
jgi:hypothetical protein